MTNQEADEIEKVGTHLMQEFIDMDEISADRLDLLDVLSSGDGQEWADLYENPGQQQIAETMYGKQADQLLASSWLASLRARVAGDAARQALDQIDVEFIARALRPYLRNVPPEMERTFAAQIMNGLGVELARARADQIPLGDQR